MSDPEASVGGTTPSDRIIGGRYRLGARRGIGLDIAIFEATDLLTERIVAVKILHPDICAAPGFAERFTTTIEQVMRTRHPNLVEVVGAGAATWNDQPVHYVVCENLNGGSLRDLRDRGRELSPSQGVMIALDVCRGLDVAHRAGLVHGDIRPGNLVFGDDGRIRVADLGLATLVAGESAGESGAMSIDRARYASPEQAMNLPVGQKSDVYALCLCIIEAVTGSLPFAGDSTVATLSNRVDRLMPVSADLGPLAAVLERAGRPEPGDRYTASEFGRALVQAAEKLPRPAPMALMSSGLFAEAAPMAPDPALSAGPDAADVTAGIPAGIPADVTADVTAGIPAGIPAGIALDADEINIANLVIATTDTANPVVTASSMTGNAPGGSGDTLQATIPVTSGAQAVGSQAPGSGPPPPPRPEVPPPLLREPTSRRKLLAVVAILVVATAIGGALAWFVGRDTSNPVPVLVGLHEGEALNMVSEFGWNVITEREASDDVAAGVVIRTDPVAGASVDKGHDFTLTVSTGPAPRVLPELAGLTVDEATAALVALGLDLQLRDQPFSETVPVGTIVSWAVPDQPSLVAGDTVLPGTNIVVSVSAGPEPRVLPDLTGFSLVDATTQLQALGLTVVPAPDEFSDQAVGAVARQDPPAGTSVPRDSAVTIVLSKGPDLVAIPALANFNLQQATDALTAAGLTVGAVKGDPAGIVVLAEANGVALAADTQLVRGTPVDLTLQAPAPPAPPAP